MFDKLKTNLPVIVALVGLFLTIGTGFIKYGEVMTKIDSFDIKSFEKSQTRTTSKIATLDKDVVVNQKEIELLKAQIKELNIKINLLTAK